MNRIRILTRHLSAQTIADFKAQGIRKIIEEESKSILRTAKQLVDDANHERVRLLLPELDPATIQIDLSDSEKNGWRLNSEGKSTQPSQKGDVWFIVTIDDGASPFHCNHCEGSDKQ